MIRILSVLFFISIGANAKTVTFGSDEVSISIRFLKTDGAKGSVPTYLRFPRAIARIDNASMFSVEAASSSGVQPDYREIEVRPRVSEGSQRIEILLNDGTVVKLKLNITENSAAPVSYDFEAKRVNETSPKATATQSQGQIADLSVMRTILEGETPTGFSKKFYSMSVNCSGSGPRARLVRIFENSQFKVFQIEIINDSYKRSYLLKEENVLLKSRDLNRSPLIHVKANILSPVNKGQNKTTMTILADPTANVNRMKICDLGDQIEIMETKNKVQK